MPANVVWKGCIGLALAAVIGAVSPAPASPQGLTVPEPIEIPLAYNFGVGTRAMGMGGAHVGVVEDATALYYNPAGLALIRRVELAAAFTHQDDKLDVDYRGEPMRSLGEPASSPLSSTKLHQLTLAYPVPTYRGSFVLGFGYHRVVSLDHDYFRLGINRDGWEEEQLFSERGGLGVYSFGLAFDASPEVSLGLSVAVLGGSYDIFYSISQDGDTFSYIQEQDIDGYTGSLGLLYKYEPIGRLGVAVQFPRKITADGLLEEAGEVWSVEDDLTLPFTLAGGIALTPPNFLLALDVRFTDWSQMEFNGRPVRFTDQFGRPRPAYESETEVHAGAEILLPDLPLRFRAGYYYDPVPYELLFTDNNYHLAQMDQERDYFTLGAGVILEEALTLDVAYVSGGFVRSAEGTVEDQDQDRIFMSIGYRF